MCDGCQLALIYKSLVPLRISLSHFARDFTFVPAALEIEMAAFANSVGAMFGSAVVGELVSRVTSFLGGQYELQSDVEGKLQRLKELLLEVESVVEAAAGKEIKNKRLVDWLMELKDVAYEADDVLDTFEYRLLEKKANEDEKVSSFASSSSNAFKRICTAAAHYTLLLRDDDVNELNTLLERLERMASKVGNFLTLLCLDGQSEKPAGVIGQRITGALPTFEHTFAGRVKEKEEIIDILLGTELSGAGFVPVLPILGIGGVGKTTLAQVIYHDERVQSHFSLKMWVCVSESFDVIRLTREMLDESGCEPSSYTGVTNFSRLQKILKEKLSSHKFLLVLDDVWNETEKEVWETIKAPLLHGKDGSKILLTSRLPNVSKLMGTMDPIKLDGLPEDEYWSFFKEYAFGGANSEEHPRLVAIGKEIASKLKGSPLAAKTMGALLNDKLDVDYWESISKSKIWELEKGQDGIMAALKLSYLQLPTHLQQCFAYLSVYPKDKRFDRRHVIQMWMAQGLICYDSRMKRIEDVGESYFNELISKSFFQPSTWSGYYTIHDLLHDLAESVSKDDCFRIEGEEFRTVPTTIRHLYLNTKHLATLNKSIFVLNKLRSLILFTDSYPSVIDADLQDVLIQLRMIRLLDLSNCNIEKCPDYLSCLIHLRYLDLSRNGRLKELPKELSKLYHLRILNLDYLRLFGVPAGMSKLINLRHLICSDEVVSKVEEIGKLTCLQKLSKFCVQKVPEFQIVQLKYLRELRGCLRIENLDCVGSEEEAKEARLCDKANLDELYLEWDTKSDMEPDEVQNGILEGLRPHPNLKELDIDGYRGTLSPSWMVLNHSFTNLVRLHLDNCSAWKDLPPLGQLPWLKDLKLRGMNAVKEIGAGFHGEKGFPSLLWLLLENFPQWEEWSADEEVTLFPRLQSFEINDCPRLKAIPSLPSTLQELKIEEVGLTILPKFSYPSNSSSSSTSSLSSSLDILTLCGCTDLKLVLGEWFLQEHNNLRHLVEVNIDHSEYSSFEPRVQQEHLMLNVFSELIGLQSLCIGNSNLFVTSDVEEDRGLLPPSLKNFMLINCSIVDNIMSKCLRGLSSLCRLELTNLSDIKIISFSQGLQQLTQLKVLTIFHCDDLSSLVGLEALHSLETLEVTNCSKLTIIIGLRQLTRLESLNILYCEELSSIDVEALSSLHIFNVFNCSKLTVINGLQHLTGLKRLLIHNCKELSSVPGLEALHTQNIIKVQGCPKLDG
ncbi:putative disease resistance protein RGA1 [Typha angustifolia]|uniref:putative disease resistance protein RGA1 n=1 Tax=Typha angustifolia TaxID=59011 RepID=UPI003C2DD1CC